MTFKLLSDSLTCDSLNYEVITQGIHAVRAVPGMTCEIGLRRGGGTKVIIDALQETGQTKTHVAIDPYGNIDYADTDKTITRYDYTNEMRDETLSALYAYCAEKKQNFMFMNMKDTDFFSRYFDGVPVYSESEHLINRYSFVHFDGPHTVVDVLRETRFFDARTSIGAIFVYDDVMNYDHKLVDAHLKDQGWKQLNLTERKWSYIKRVMNP